MEDFYIGGASVKLFLPIFRMNFPEIVDIALPAESVFLNLVFVSIRKTYPMQAYKSACGRPSMHCLWGMGKMMFTKYLVVVDAECWRAATMTCTTPAKSSSASAPTPTRNATAGWPSAWTHQRPV